MSQIKLALIISDFNQQVTSQLRQGAINQAQKQQVEYEVFTVPGAVELPYAAQCAAKSGHFDAIVMLGCVVRGETGHYDYVCQQVSHGCQQIMLSYELPVIFGVLTTENQTQALVRANGEKIDKGAYSVDAAIQMIKLSNDPRLQ